MNAADKGDKITIEIIKGETDLATIIAPSSNKQVAMHWTVFLSILETVAIICGTIIFGIIWTQRKREALGTILQEIKDIKKKLAP